MKPEWIVLKSSSAGMGLEEPEQLRLPSRGMQQIAVDSCTHVDGSIGWGGVIFLQAVIRMKPERPPQFAALQEFVIMPMVQQH